MKNPDTKFQKGQSIAEFIVTMAVLVPLLLVLASFSNLLTLNTETVEAGRLAAWERTIYTESDEFGVDGSFIEDRIADNVRRIYLKKSYTDFGPGKELNGGSLPSVVDRTVNGGQPVSVRTPAPGAIAGIGMVNENTRLVQTLGSAVNNNFAMVSPEISIAINSDYSLLKAVSFEDYRRVNYEDPDSVPNDAIAGRNQFNTSSHSALVAGGWMPGSSADFAVATSSAAFDGSGQNHLGERQALGYFEGDRTTIPALDFLGFDEVDLVRGDGGFDTTSEAQDTLLPSDL